MAHHYGMTGGMARERALVLFSGGQDSATCLAWALDRFEYVETLGFDYQQRHRIELDLRLPLRAGIAAIKPAWQQRLGEDHCLEVGILGAISETSLTRSMVIEMAESGLPNSFVPGRNLMFLTLAAALAYRRDLSVLVTGVCETDFSGYPDCRDDTMKALQVALSLGLDRRVRIDTPLMWIDKAQTWAMAAELGGEALVQIIIEQSHTCYLGEREPHPWGAGCGYCPACELRARGWQQWMDGQNKDQAG